MRAADMPVCETGNTRETRQAGRFCRLRGFCRRGHSQSKRPYMPRMLAGFQCLFRRRRGLVEIGGRTAGRTRPGGRHGSCRGEARRYPLLRHPANMVKPIFHGGLHDECRHDAIPNRGTH